MRFRYIVKNNTYVLKHLRLFEDWKADDIRDKQKIVNDDPKLAKEIGQFYELQNDIKALEEDLMKKKDAFKQFEMEIRPMLDCMKEMNIKLSLTNDYLIQITRFGGERRDASYKNAFENALTKVNASTRKVLEAALEASRSVTQVKHSFKIDKKLEEASIIDNVKNAIKKGINAFLNIFKKEENEVDKANKELQKLAK